MTRLPVYVWVENLAGRKRRDTREEAVSGRVVFALRVTLTHLGHKLDLRRRQRVLLRNGERQLEGTAFIRCVDGSLVYAGIRKRCARACARPHLQVPLPAVNVVVIRVELNVRLARSALQLGAKAVL